MSLKSDHILKLWQAWWRLSSLVYIAWILTASRVGESPVNVTRQISRMEPNAIWPACRNFGNQGEFSVFNIEVVEIVDKPRIKDLVPPLNQPLLNNYGFEVEHAPINGNSILTKLHEWICRTTVTSNN